MVDPDVDVSDIRQVATAVALHVRPDRDIYILPPSLGTELDPASDGSTPKVAKFGMDATVADVSTRRIARNRVPKHVLDTTRLSEFVSPR